MPGARPRGFRLGDRSELLVEYLLGGVAFTTRVPRQEDVGIDFMCSLITGSHKARLLKAGPFFSVQAKSPSEELVYEKPHELQWITQQKNPLLICVADRAAGAMNVYSTWNLICAVENGWKGQASAGRISLRPGECSGEWPWVRDNPDRSQDVLLGKPIVRVTHDQLFNEDATEGIVKVLQSWVAIDWENIVNCHAGLHFVIGPRAYETGEPIGGPHAGGHYWNPQNLEKCHQNLGRAAAAMWNVLKSHPRGPAEQAPWSRCIPRLRELLLWLVEVDPNLRAFVVGLDG